MLRGPAAVGDPGPPRPRGVHAEERPEVHARVGAHGARSGRRRRSARCRTRCATTGARCCGSRTSARSSTTRRWCTVDRPDRITHLVLDLDPPEGEAFAMAVRGRRASSAQALAEVGLDGAVKTSGAKGVHVFVPVDDDAPMEDAAAATRAIAARAERLDPDDRDDRVHEGGPRRQGVRRLDPGRRAPPWSRRTARGCGRACPCRSPWAGTISMTSRRPTSPCTPRSNSSATATRGRPDARAAAPQRGADRGGPRHPGRSGAGHARGKTPGASAALLTHAPRRL